MLMWITVPFFSVKSDFMQFKPVKILKMPYSKEKFPEGVTDDNKIDQQSDVFLSVNSN